MSHLVVTRTYLEMREERQLVPASLADPGLRIERVQDCPASFFRYLYVEVGRAHHWVDRLPWTDAHIRAYLASPSVSLWVLFAGGAPAGYFELARQDDSTEIAYFGLLPDFKGRGLGKYLLTVAVRQAWADGAARVWLHTCSLDDRAALPNYKARGFVPFRQEQYEVEA